MLRRKAHPNPYLQNAWDKYGEDNFEFSVIEEIDPDELEARELFYIRILNACEDGYNLMEVDPKGGFKHSEETKKKLRDIVNDVWRTAEGIGRIKALRKGTKQHEYKGKFKTSKEWAKKFGVNFTSFRQRLASGMTVEEAKNIKPLYRMVMHKGKMMSLKDIATLEGVEYKKLWGRLKYYGTMEEAIKKPIGKTASGMNIYA